MLERPIRFGTSGWRGVLAEEFTFERVRAVAAAIGDYLVEEGSREVLVGFDTRFLSERFGEHAAGVLASKGLAVYLSDRAVPTPVVAFEILSRRTAGGVNVTASHNPAEWNGIKFSSAWGGPALPEVTQAIEARANRILEEGSVPPPPSIREVKRESFGESYRAALLRYLDPKVFSGWRVAVDLFFGTAQGYLDRILHEGGAEVDLLHPGRDPLFGGMRPDPEGENLKTLIDRVREGQYDLGVGTDCDADRFGVVDRGGAYVPPNVIIALLLDYLVREKGMKGKVARSCATSHLVDAVAAHHGLELIETPVGFKYIGERIAKDELLLGGEESGGISIRGHLPEKDGILTSLLVAEMVASRRLSLAGMLAELFRRVGAYYSRRLDLQVAPDQKQALFKRLDSPPPTFAGKKVVRVGRLDGYKFYLDDGSWVLVRPSGTEPVVRFYMEVRNERDLPWLESALRKLLREGER
jgi:alpha-D-glucose phosphate-specific phosphoglucomutase